MKITIDNEKKTIAIKEGFLFSDILKELNDLFPDSRWREFTLVVEKEEVESFAPYWTPPFVPDTQRRPRIEIVSEPAPCADEYVNYWTNIEPGNFTKKNNPDREHLDYWVKKHKELEEEYNDKNEKLTEENDLMNDDLELIFNFQNELEKRINGSKKKDNKIKSSKAMGECFKKIREYNIKHNK